MPLKNWNIVYKKTLSLDKDILITAILCLPDLDVIATGNNCGNITMWRMANYKPIYSKSIHKSDISSLCYLNNGKTLFAGSSDGKISKVVFNIETNKFSYVLSDKVEGTVIGLCSYSDGGNLLSGMNNMIVYWDIESCRFLRDFEITETAITSLFFCNKMKLVLVGTQDSKIKFFNPVDQKINFVIDGAHDFTPVYSLATCFHPETGLTLCSIGEDKKLKFWNVENYNKTEKKKNYYSLIKTELLNNTILKVGSCYDYKTVLLVFDTGIFTLFNLETGEQKEFSNKDKKVAFSNGAYVGDGKNFVFVASEGTLDFYGLK